MPHGDDHISFFVPFVHVAVRLGNLLQWIDPVDDRSDLPRFNEFFEEDEIFGFRRRPPPISFLPLVRAVQRMRMLIPGEDTACR